MLDTTVLTVLYILICLIPNAILKLIVPQTQTTAPHITSSRRTTASTAAQTVMMHSVTFACLDLNTLRVDVDV